MERENSVSNISTFTEENQNKKEKAKKFMIKGKSKYLI
jgi:hypothetical protein